MGKGSEREHVKMSSKLWLGGADCSITTLNNIITGGGLTFFFVDYLGLSKELSALCWLIFGIWNAINDPLFGYISDKTKTKIGRRIPYIRYGSIAVSIVFILSWFVCSKDSTQGLMFATMLASLFFFDTLYTAIATSLYVMPFEMAVTNEARSKILFVKVIFGLVALSVPLALLGMINGILSNSEAFFKELMIIIGVAAGVIIFFSTFFYKENGYTTEEEQYPFFKSLATCFKNKNFLVFESISFSVTFIQTALMFGLGHYFATFYVSATPGAADSNFFMLCCYVAMFVGIIFGIWFWMKPGSKFGVKKSIVLMCLIFGGGLLFMLLLGRLLVGGIVGFFCSGIGFAGGMYVVQLMNGDVVDYDEHLSGLRREGMYAGVNSFVCKPAISIANAVIPLIRAAFGFNSDIALIDQTPLAKTGILVSWLLIPAVLLFLCAFVIQKWYSLAGQEWNDIKTGLSEIHDKKQKAYEEEMLAKHVNE